MTEEWRQVPGYEGLYEVSDQGRVRRAGRVLSPGPHSQGYTRFNLCKDSVRRPFMGHQLVLLAFVGPRPEGQETRHLDGNPANNCLTNLCYGLPSDNGADRVAHGTQRRGQESPRAKLTESDVRSIRSLGLRGARQVDLAAVFGVSQTCIGRVLQRKLWRHV
jgi:hypothetical protein